MEQATSLKFDLDLTASSIQELVASLGFNIQRRIEQTAASLRIESESIRRPFKWIELIANQEWLFQVCLFERTSVTDAQTSAQTRAFPNRAGNYLHVLTSKSGHTHDL